MRAVVVVASNRAAAGVYEDRGGTVLVDGLREMGFAVDGPVGGPGCGHGAPSFCR